MFTSIARIRICRRRITPRFSSQSHLWSHWHLQMLDLVCQLHAFKDRRRARSQRRCVPQWITNGLWKLSARAASLQSGLRSARCPVRRSIQPRVISLAVQAKRHVVTLAGLGHAPRYRPVSSCGLGTGHARSDGTFLLARDWYDGHPSAGKLDDRGTVLRQIAARARGGLTYKARLHL